MRKSSPPKYSFLLDANLSRKIITELTAEFEFDFKHISDVSPEILSDSEIVEIAKLQNRIVLTHDLDYGEIYYLRERGSFGVIMFRLKDQSSENVIRRLKSFFHSPQFQTVNLSKSLVIISDENIRIFSDVN